MNSVYGRHTRIHENEAQRLSARLGVRDLFLLVALGVLFSGIASAQTGNAADLMRRAFKNYYAEKYLTVVRLGTIGSDGEVARWITLQIIRDSSIDEDRSLMRFIDPPQLRGASFLTVSSGSEAPVTYAYLPDVAKVRRIVGAQRSDQFFGTDLAIEDLEPKRSENYLASEAPANGEECASVRIVPKGYQSAAYDEMLSCIDRKRGVFVRIDFRIDGESVKQLDLEPESVREVAGRNVAFRMRMRNLRRGTATAIETLHYAIAEKIAEHAFSLGNLGSGDYLRDRKLVSEIP